MANAESKGTSINQHKAAVKSTSSLMQDDLKMLDKELSKEQKPEPKPPAAKPEEPKKEDKPIEKKIEDKAESWFTASMSKFRALKKRMFSALSFLPQTGSDGGEGPDDFDNTQISNQQKLGLFDAIVNQEEDNEDGDKL